MTTTFTQITTHQMFDLLKIAYSVIQNNPNIQKNEYLDSVKEKLLDKNSTKDLLFVSNLAENPIENPIENLYKSNDTILEEAKLESEKNKKRFVLKTTSQWKEFISRSERFKENISDPLKKEEYENKVNDFYKICQKPTPKRQKKITNLDNKYFTKDCLIFEKYSESNNDYEINSKIPCGFLFSDNSFLFF